MKEISNKYKKHATLVFFGLKTQEELDKDLARYDVSEIEKIKSDILADMQASKVPKTYIISLVPKLEYYKLPNKLIKSEEDFEGLEDFVSSHRDVSEVWRFQKENDGMIGRFSISESGEQIVEQIWGTNHRDLDNYNNQDASLPLIRASRERWGVGYAIHEMRGLTAEDKERIKKGFIQAILEIERNREKIEMMLEEFQKADLHELAIEYRIDSKGFAFIDWDSSNDRKILNRLFNDETEHQGR